jgi:hypothetical protein
MTRSGRFALKKKKKKKEGISRFNTRHYSRQGVAMLCREEIRRDMWASLTADIPSDPRARKVAMKVQQLWTKKKKSEQIYK